MDRKRKEQIKAALVSRFKGLLDEHGEEVFKDYREAFIQHDSEKPFVFAVGFAGKLSLSGPEHKVGGKIRWNIPKSYDAIDVILNNNDMFDEDAETKEDVAEAAGKKGADVIDVEPSKVDGVPFRGLPEPSGIEAYVDPKGKAAGGAPLFVDLRKGGGYSVGYMNPQGRRRSVTAYGLCEKYPTHDGAILALRVAAEENGWECERLKAVATGTEGGEA